MTLPPDVPAGTVVRLRGSKQGPTPAHAAVLRLVAEADDALAAVSDGDVDYIFSAHRAINEAVGIVLDNRLSSRWPNTPTCDQCGAERSYGRCWGCGAPPSGRAS